MPRSLAAAASPALAGALFAAGYQAWPLVICGALKILYDLALLWAFRHVKPPEESYDRTGRFGPRHKKREKTCACQVQPLG